jgi:hypothetical protein
MVAIQPYGWQVIPYQADIVLSGTEVYVGSGKVYSQQPHLISTYGSSKKSYTMKAENNNGNSVVYAYSDTAKKFIRYNSTNGISSLSDDNKARTWFLNNTNYIQDEFDLVLGFDRERQAVFITANVDANTWSLMWNEKKNYFQCFFTALPGRYFTSKGRVMAPNIASPYGNIYLLFKGTDYLKWFSDTIQGTFQLEWAVNSQGGFTPERFVGTGIIVDEQDYSAYDNNDSPTFIVSNDFQTSTMTPDMTEYKNGQIGVGIFPTASEEPIISNYAKIKVSTQNYIRIYSLITRFYAKQRSLLR